MLVLEKGTTQNIQENDWKWRGRAYIAKRFLHKVMSDNLTTRYSLRLIISVNHSLRLSCHLQYVQFYAIVSVKIRQPEAHREFVPVKLATFLSSFDRSINRSEG